VTEQILIIHYTKNAERRHYLESRLPSTRFITDHDRESESVKDTYSFDKERFLEMLNPIKEIMVGYAVGLRLSGSRVSGTINTTPWREYVSAQRSLGLTLERTISVNPWLAPRELNRAQVSLFMKHRMAWKIAADSACDWSIIAEDDILLRNDSNGYLEAVLHGLPHDFDYIDIAGGCGLVPRPGNQCVNKYFYHIVPPRDRSTCCAIMRTRFARALTQMELPICLPVDWTLTHAFTRARATVYWTAPTVFDHGSEIGAYQSSIRS
jgi:hypothetical protein